MMSFLSYITVAYTHRDEYCRRCQLVVM